MQIKLHEHLVQTIQGEGTHAGRLADFVRVYGCPVGCSWCDTGYSVDNGHGKDIKWDLKEVEEFIDELCSDFIVISGGEPFFWPRLPDFVNLLEAEGFEVAIETSGTKWKPISPKTWITLSPKEHLPEVKLKTDPLFWKRADEIKIIIESRSDYLYYENELDQLNTPIFLQPEYSIDKVAVRQIRNLMMGNPKIRLSGQLHKYLQLP